MRGKWLGEVLQWGGVWGTRGAVCGAVCAPRGARKCAARNGVQRIEEQRTQHAYAGHDSGAGVCVRYVGSVPVEGYSASVGNRTAYANERSRTTNRCLSLNGGRWCGSSGVRQRGCEPPTMFCNQRVPFHVPNDVHGKKYSRRCRYNWGGKATFKWWSEARVSKGVGEKGKRPGRKENAPLMRWTPVAALRVKPHVRCLRMS